MYKVLAIIAMILGVILLFTIDIDSSVVKVIIVVIWAGVILRDWTRDVPKTQRISTTLLGTIFIFQVLGILSGELLTVAFAFALGVLLTVWYYNRS